MVIPAYLERMLNEQNDLEDKITKGRAAVNNMALPITDEERALLSKQMSHYEQALAILIIRIDLAKKKEGVR